MQRRSALLLAAVVIAVSFALPAYSAESGGTLDDCLHMNIPSLTANPGEDITVPVYISDVTGWGVMAFEVEICWCELPAGLLQYVGCKPGMMMHDANWSISCGACGPNCISVAGAGAVPLNGSGPLFYLYFHVSANAKPCMCCDIWFTEINLYDPEDPLNVCWRDGEICIEHCDVYGATFTWWCTYGDCGEVRFEYPLPGVRAHVSRCGEPIATDYTDARGLVAFECLEPLHNNDGGLIDCGYCMTVDYCPIPREWINPFDAALILQYLVCTEQLDCCAFPYCNDPSLGGGMVYPQRIAADVNCTSVITAYDASLILQYVVGLIPAFPCPDPWVWEPIIFCDECQEVCPAYFFFLGILKGDVSGMCYRPDETPTLAATSTVKLGVPKHFDGYVEVPVKVKHADNVYSTQFEVTYNAGDFDVTQVRGSGLGAGMMTAYNADNGNLLIAMAGSTPFSGNGTVATVTLQKKHTPIPVASTRLELTSALLNETAPVIEGHEYDGEVVRFALGPVSPNPFRDAAVISYSAPKAASVSIGVYDVNGRLVQTVYSGQVEAGAHQVTWDGKDTSGSRVARGVYFCRMSAGEFSATEKMVLLQ
ncbi:MAG: FlgD immunoglobulin-like domain containing protein [bacterium]|jgi:hypothetical protein